jgi:hypothetical protein
MLWPRCELRPADVVRVRFGKKKRSMGDIFVMHIPHMW